MNKALHSVKLVEEREYLRITPHLACSDVCSTIFWSDASTSAGAG
jgi:hypothetical protein